jgi:putative ABC transport system permease protein
MNDLRYALRTLLRNRAFTLTAALMLALGIGATTAIFSVVNAVLLQPLPYHDPDRLVVTRLSYPDYLDVRRSSQSFEQTAVWASNLYNLEIGDESRQVTGGVISRELLPLLGVMPAAGRNFTEEEDRQRTVILGHGLWQSMFGGDVSAVGRTITLSGTAYTVIGVAPAGFAFPTSEFQLWTPIGLLEVDARAQSENRALRIFTAIGRLKPGITLEQVRAELVARSADLARTYPATNAEIVLNVNSLSERLIGEARRPLMMLLGTVALLLLIACANVANLVLTRTSAREREMAIRAALGASRRRLLAQLATEALVLAVLGGLGGVLVAMWAIDLLPASILARLPHVQPIRLDGPVLLAALASTLFTTVIFGLAPALQMRADSAAIKERGVAGGVRASQLRAGIVVAEVALAVIVVAGAGLLVRSFVALTARDPGFIPDNVLSFQVQLLKLPDGAARARAASTLLDRLSQLPGVEAAGASTGLPAVTPQRGTRFEIEGRELTPAESGAHFLSATPDYFRAVRTTQLQGRPFEPTDTAGSEPVAVINQALANRVFPGIDPVGRRLRVVNPEYSGDWRTIVGVVGDVRYRGLGDDVQPTIYAAFEQTPFPWLYVMVRSSSGDGAALARSVRGIVPQVDPRLSAGAVRPMTDVVRTTVEEPRLSMLLLSGFAALALLLAAVGIYGVIAYSVAQRTREIGVRMAVGADRRRVMTMVIREGLVMALVGVALGTAGAVIAARRMTDLLVDVTAHDPVAFGAAAGMLVAVAVAACYLPARRATRVDPLVALRAE